MMGLLSVFFISVLSSEFILGTTLNAFIVVAHCLDWRKTKDLASSDKIIMALCISRFFLQCCIAILNFFSTFLSELYSRPYSYEISLVLTIFLSLTSLWIATLLSVFYCVKITTYNFPIFLFLKTRISKLVPWLLWCCLPASLASSLPLGFYMFDLSYKNSTVNNSTQEIVMKSRNVVNQSLIHTTCSSVPFAIFSVSVWLLIHSLCRHTRKMQKSVSSYRGPNLDTHIGVVRSLIVFFFLYIAYFLCMNVSLFGLMSIDSPWVIFVSVLISAYPFLHSVILIFTSNKLRKTFIDLACTLLPQRMFSKISR